MEPPLFGWSRSQFFCWPELRASFWQVKKGKPCSCDKHDLKAIYKGRYDPKKTYINNSLIKSSKLKILMYGAAFFYWSRSRPNLARAGIGSGTSDFRSWSSPKQWQMRNTGYFFLDNKYTSYKIYISDIIISFLGTGTRFSSSFKLNFHL